jgi:hypothetical protein
VASIDAGGNFSATSLIPSQLTGSGTVPTAALGSGTASSTTYLRGDSTWATPAGGSASTFDSGTFGYNGGSGTNALPLSNNITAGWSNAVRTASNVVFGLIPSTNVISAPLLQFQTLGGTNAMMNTNIANGGSTSNLLATVIGAYGTATGWVTAAVTNALIGTFLQQWQLHSTNDFYGTNQNLQSGTVNGTNWAAHSTNDYQPTTAALTKLNTNDASGLTNFPITVSNYFNNWGTNAGAVILTNSAGQQYVSNNVYTNTASWSGGTVTSGINVTGTTAGITNTNTVGFVGNGIGLINLDLSNQVVITLTNALQTNIWSAAGWTNISNGFQDASYNISTGISLRSGNITMTYGGIQSGYQIAVGQQGFSSGVSGNCSIAFGDSGTTGIAAPASGSLTFQTNTFTYGASTATNGFASYNTNILLAGSATTWNAQYATIASGITNTYRTNMVYNYSGTSGTINIYSAGGVGGVNAAANLYFSGTVVAGLAEIILPPNWGVQITSGVGMTAAAHF